jgi:poly-gamma-glutamate capsule biosynthesis protein CapA/YwtB (metallophosphatase superfamily)
VPGNPIAPLPPLLVTLSNRLLVVLTGLAALSSALVVTRSTPAEGSAERGPLGSGKAVVLAFGGDVHFEGVLRSKLDASPSTVLAPIAPVLQRADIAMVNLETAVTTRGTAQSKQFVFRAPPTAFAALRGGSVDVATMANNHGLDYGLIGLRDSLAAAKSYHFPVVGIGLDGKQAYAPYRVTVNGQRIAVLGATQVIDDQLIRAWTAGPNDPGLASAKDVPRLVAAVRQARRTSDTVVVYVHWGVELDSCPTVDQRTLARQLVAAGADVVIGSHAHVLLGTGRMGSTLVSYGLGNFAFYASREETVRSGVLFVTVTGHRVDGYHWAPARISDGVLHPLSGTERRQALASWRSLRGCTGLEP